MQLYLTNNKLRSQRKKVLQLKQNQYPSTCLNGLRETTKWSVRIADVWAEIRVRGSNWWRDPQNAFLTSVSAYVKRSW